MKFLPLALSAMLCLCLTAPSAADEPLPPPIVALDVKPEAVAYSIGRNEAVKIGSADEAAKYFNKDAVATLKKKVDFSKQIVLVFGWRGSGQDQLNFVVAESFPEQVTFRLRPGRTRDLRTHAKVFALRSDVKWRTK